VFINDDERGLHQDCDDWLGGQAPHEPIGKYRHNRTGEDNFALGLLRRYHAAKSYWGLMLDRDS
jgi:thiamine phosphate synthase YjbQ (UPF0047 family)